MSVFKEFKEFAMKGNVVDLATGVIIGTAFGKIVSSLVSDVLMPLISLLTGKIDFTNMFVSLDGKTYETLQQAKDAGAATLNYGLFFTNIIDFIIIAFAIFIMIKQVNRFTVNPAPAVEVNTKTCGYCQSSVHISAIRCPHCTSNLE